MRLGTIDTQRRRVFAGIEVRYIEQENSKGVKEKVPYVELGGDGGPHSRTVHIYFDPSSPPEVTNGRVYHARYRRDTTSGVLLLTWADPQDCFHRPMLVRVDTRGSRHRPDVVAGCHRMLGRVKVLVTAYGRRGNTGRGGSWHDALVKLNVGAVMLVTPEGPRGTQAFAVVYDRRVGLRCDTEVVSIFNKVRHDERYAKTLVKQEAQREAARAKAQAKRAARQQRDADARKPVFVDGSASAADFTSNAA